MYANIFDGKKVLLTGNTGFKGSWLTAWLCRLGAKVTGFSKDIPTSPAHFTAAAMEHRITQFWGDVRDAEILNKVIADLEPDFVFHLAAQPLVRRSYADPSETFTTNVVGTLNVLDALRLVNAPCTAVIITSDKCYDNVEQVWGYRETDRLGGKDPYSASKGAAELVIRSYVESYFKQQDSRVRIGIGRAGNVIGGADWALDRIVPDAIRAWASGKSVEIRNPKATRPWQHVLEPLSGYLQLASLLTTQTSLNGEAYNFGPLADQNQSVAELLDELSLHWPGAAWNDVSGGGGVYEAGLLKLACDKALRDLFWRPTLNFPETVKMTSEWYRQFYASCCPDAEAVWRFTVDQIDAYAHVAVQRGVAWTC